ncbi:hypothetical protein ACFWHQ_40105, partial [Streptomyces sp. NPDC060334]|uniref:hypothetical protein n=1 Tax=Streptomyces sp. NPDC060334 TaxID=3347099 RepID=UPI00365BAD85
TATITKRQPLRQDNFKVSNRSAAENLQGRGRRALVLSEGPGWRLARAAGIRKGGGQLCDSARQVAVSERGSRPAGLAELVTGRLLRSVETSARLRLAHN